MTHTYNLEGTKVAIDNYHVDIGFKRLSLLYRHHGYRSIRNMAKWSTFHLLAILSFNWFKFPHIPDVVENAKVAIATGQTMGVTRETTVISPNPAPVRESPKRFLSSLDFCCLTYS